MDNTKAPKLSKWPFVLGDLFLLGFAGLVIYLSVWPIGIWLILVSGVATLAGAWLCVTPFLLEYRAEVERAQTDAVLSSLNLLQNLEKVGAQIASATGQWQTAQEIAEKTALTAKGVMERMVAETQAFTQFLQKANDAEKAHLRLEVDKLRRSEAEWLQITTALLDHVFALYQAAVRSGQPGLIEQLGHFQNACRDVVRRVGLVPFVPEENSDFDPKVHRAANGNGEPPTSARIRQTVAAGYTYQGQFLRPALVDLHPGITPPEPAPDLLADAGLAQTQSAPPAEPEPPTPPPATEPPLDPTGNAQVSRSYEQPLF